jgi:hypothetical protein
MMRLPLGILFMFAVGQPIHAFAALEVDFETAPLFSAADVLPGDAVERAVMVTNTGSESETIEFTFENVIFGDLASVMELAVDDGEILWVFDTFDDVLFTGPHPLGDIAPGTSRTFNFRAALPIQVGNAYQSQQFGFDVRIGFVGAPQVTDRRSGGRSQRFLELFNEQVTVDVGAGGAFVTWDSNRPATTYLVCGEVSDGPFILTDEAPLFGYRFALAELKETVTAHGQVLTDLEPGTVYECRPAGRERAGAAFTVGDPVRFTMPQTPPGEVAGASTSLSPADIQAQLQAIIDSRPQASVRGATGKGVGNMTYEEFRTEMDALMAAQPAAAPEAVDPPPRADIRPDQGLAQAAAVGAARENGWLSWLFLGLLVPFLGWLVWRTLSLS